MADNAPLTLNLQYIKDLSFECPGAPEIFTRLREMPPIQVKVNIDARPLAANVFEVLLDIHAEAGNEEGVAFLVELSYGAVVTLDGVPDDSIQPVLLIEVPRLLFPFARNIIADITRDGGFPALMLSPIDFVALFRQRMGMDQEVAGNA